MQYTDNYQLKKPEIGVDRANVEDFNYNAGKIDELIHDTQTSICDAYDDTRTAQNPYTTGDLVMQYHKLWKCLEDDVYGAWDSTKWEETTIEKNLDSGSNVEVTPIITEGDKIATITVDEQETDLYAPVPQIYETVSGEFITVDDAAAGPVKALSVTLEPQQDLHGYDSPWISGGKNMLPLTIDNIKTNNGGAATWSGNSKTINNVTFTILTDSDGNVMGIKANGTASDTMALFIATFNVVSGIQYTINGCPANGTSSTYELMLTVGGVGTGAKERDYGNGVTYTEGETRIRGVQVVIRSGYNAQNLMFYPMVRLASVTDPTFAPYSNICPISGWDEVNVGVSGVNVWDEEWELGLINSNNGSNYPSNNNIRSKYIPIKSGNYYFKTPQNSFIFGYDKNKNYIGRVAGSGAYKNALMTITDTNCAFIRFYVDSSYGTTYNNDISINYPSTDTEYHAYNGQTYTIQLGNTCYGGELDVKSGVLKVTDGYIASYNGETLPSTWISDRDVYAPNTSPTTGAEVVYKLATPQEIQLTPTEVPLLRGINNIWSDGELELTYLEDLVLLIDKLKQLLNSNSGTRSLSLTKSASIDTKVEEETKTELIEGTKEETKELKEETNEK